MCVVVPSRKRNDKNIGYISIYVGIYTQQIKKLFQTLSCAFPNQFNRINTQNKVFQMKTKLTAYKSLLTRLVDVMAYAHNHGNPFIYCLSYNEKKELPLLLRYKLISMLEIVYIIVALLAILLRFSTSLSAHLHFHERKFFNKLRWKP